MIMLFEVKKFSKKGISEVEVRKMVKRWEWLSLYRILELISIKQPYITHSMVLGRAIKLT